jgi:hypothetical protein
MVSLDYQLDPSWNRPTGEADLAHATELALRNDYFLGDIMVRIGEFHLRTRLGWLPVLDFAVTLRETADSLHLDEEGAYEFTESDAKISFDRQGERIRVTSTEAPGAGEAPFLEFARAARAFARKVITDLCARYPSLVENPFLRQQLGLLEGSERYDENGAGGNCT